MELFLTSSVHAVAFDIAKKVDFSKGRKLVFIDTAAEPKGEREDLEWLKNDRQALVNAGFIVSDYTITDKTSTQLQQDLSDFNFIYMSGGNTSHLLLQSQKSGFINLIDKLIKDDGKIYIGTSAGSIIAGPKLPDYFNDEEITLENRNCYGLVNFTLLPHWGSEDFKDRYLGERLKMVYKNDQVPLVLLTDNEYVHVRDDQFNIVNLSSN